MLPEGTGCSQHFKRFAAKMRDYWQFIDELFTGCPKNKPVKQD